MADRWIPSDLIRATPLWRNAFENATTVQFNHRHLAEATALFILGAWAYSLRLPAAPTRPDRLAPAGSDELAAAHQAGALTTLSVALWLSTELRWIKRLPK
ncbi:Cytochrome c oxidase assembly protein cox15 [Tyrophagus putrescentiae]|nr:Cytochrome c oxidase assembly protein cox15 [Tyrophagus putrescentiae]